MACIWHVSLITLLYQIKTFILQVLHLAFHLGMFNWFGSVICITAWKDIPSLDVLLLSFYRQGKWKSMTCPKPYGKWREESSNPEFLCLKISWFSCQRDWDYGQSLAATWPQTPLQEAAHPCCRVEPHTCSVAAELALPHLSAMGHRADRWGRRCYLWLE